ncbi:hypothetical protein SDC9_104350 [bioreactor metagenome]|uniref:Uncharacterized protein n=1 Tax=bioreactor metagenome TaxID=1076179 RepID=A0A645AXN7_9ZZZZ
MLRIHRDNFRPVPVRRVHHQLPGAHQRLLVSQRDALSLFNGGQRRPKAHHAHHGGHHCVRSVNRRRFQKPLGSGNDFYVQISDPAAKFLRGRRVIQRHKTRQKLPRLPLQKLQISAPGGQRFHTQLQLLRHIQRLPPDGAGGAQQ